MKTRIYLLITLLLSLSLLLIACGGETAEPAVKAPPIVEVEEPAGEAPAADVPVVAEAEEAEPEPVFTEADLDNAVSAMLGRMTAYNTIRPDALNEALAEEPGVLLIDVRTAAEVEENGIIESDNQMQIAIEDFIVMKDQWPQDKDSEIIVYCGTGHRSTMVMSILWLYDYTNVRSMKGGLAEWRTGGYPVLGGAEPEVDLDTAFNNFIDNMVAYNTIRPAALNELLIEDPPPFILDVRRPAELEEQGHIEGAMHIPLTDIGDHLDLLPSFDTPIVAYCAIGWRCTIAMTALGTMGWTDVKALIGGSFGGWVNEGYPVVATVN